jgi:hypothetical protein
MWISLGSHGHRGRAGRDCRRDLLQPHAPARRRPRRHRLARPRLPPVGRRRRDLRVPGPARRPSRRTTLRVAALGRPDHRHRRQPGRQHRHRRPRHHQPDHRRMARRRPAHRSQTAVRAILEHRPAADAPADTCAGEPIGVAHPRLFASPPADPSRTSADRPGLRQARHPARSSPTATWHLSEPLAPCETNCAGAACRSPGTP